MALPTHSVPTLLQDPGYLLIAPLVSTEPTNSITASAFTDSWDAAWIPLGATLDGSTFNYSLTVTPVYVAEYLDPVKQNTTGRDGSIAFTLANYTASNLSRALNNGSGAVSAVSGTGGTTLSKVEPVDPGNEVRVMIGWESEAHNVRLVCRQTINAASLSMAFAKRPGVTGIACEFRFEVPAAGTKPFTAWFAGATLQGT